MKYAIDTARPILVKQKPDKSLWLLFVDVDGVNREFPLNVVHGVDPGNLPRPLSVTERGETRVSEVDKLAVRRPFELAGIGAGDLAIWTPAPGRRLRVKAFQFSTNADVEVGLRFGTTEIKWGTLQTRGAVAMNLLGCYTEGEVNQPLNCRVEGAVTVKGVIFGEEI